MTMKPNFLKKEFEVLTAKTREIWHVDMPNVKKSISDLKLILKCVKKNKIKIINKVTVSDNVREDIEAVVVPKIPKKRGRPQKASAQEYNRSQSVSLEHSVTSTASLRNRRVSTQVTEYKLAHVHRLMKGTPLKRLTNIDEKEPTCVAVVASPPPKCRKTNQKSAGSSFLGSSHGENVDYEVQLGKLSPRLFLEKECIPVVNLKRVTTPGMKSYRNSTKNRSFEKTSDKRKGEDICNKMSKSNDYEHSGKDNEISRPIIETDLKNTDLENNNLLDGTFTVDVNSTFYIEKKNAEKKKFIGQKSADRETSSIEEEIHELGKETFYEAQSSPVSRESYKSEGVFNGFNFLPFNSDVVGKRTMLLRENTFVKENIKYNEAEVVNKKMEEIKLHLIKKEVSPDEEETIKETGQEDNENQHDEVVVVDHKQDESLTLTSRTKVIMKAVQRTEEETNSGEEVQGNDDQRAEKEVQSECESPEINIRSRTKIIKKKIDSGEEKKNSSGEECRHSLRSTTKTIGKGFNSIDAIEEGYSKYSEFKLLAVPYNKQIQNNAPESPKSPADELVKKAVEGFEKLKKEEQVEVEERGRCTRNAAHNRAVSSCSTGSQKIKQNRGAVQLTSHVQSTEKVFLIKGKQNKRKVDKENVESTRVAWVSKTTPAVTRRVTPLAIRNKLTPAIGSNNKLLVINKGIFSARRQTPVETNIAVVQKLMYEEVEKKKEEGRWWFEAKDDDAKKKKESALKATADANRRKREDKIHRAAAAREAAEKKKMLLAAKTEKEKEEKIRQIAVEKEKQKEEQLKKKLLMQQKASEHEVRRKQEEAARLAKHKKPESEHKRVLTMKEREREILKQQIPGWVQSKSHSTC